MSRHLRYITDNSRISHSEISYPTDISDLICPCRIPLSLFPSTLMCWMTPPTSLVIIASMPALSCYSCAICGRGTGGFRKDQWHVRPVVGTVRTSPDLNWCSTPNLQHLRAPGPDQFWSNGNSGDAKVLRALAHASTLRGPVSNFWGRVPLIPLFLQGSFTPTIP